jgi:hypothetical protein
MKPPSDVPNTASRRLPPSVLAFTAALTVIGLATVFHRLHGGMFVSLLLIAAGWSTVRLVALGFRREKATGWWKRQAALSVGLFVAAFVTAGVIG